MLYIIDIISHIHIVTLALESCTLTFYDLLPICQKTQRGEMHESFELQKSSAVIYGNQLLMNRTTRYK